LTIQQGSETVQRPGKYVMVWKQEGSDWKADVDIWNS
jgi:ketosteroid isomerase-like protein